MRGHNRNNNHHNHNNNNNNNNNSQRLSKLNVQGWTQSTAASNPDGGINSLQQWLEKKASKKIIKSWRSNDVFVILVDPADAHRFTHLNGFTFASAQITVQDQSNQNQNGNVQPPAGPKNQQNNQNQIQNNNQNNQNSRGGRGGRGGTRGGFQNDRRNDSMQLENQSGSGADEVEAALVSIIRRRYQAGAKFLNLERLPDDADIQAIGLTSQPASKVFTALFVCCETKVFETPLKRQQMVESLSLSGNGLTSVKDCIAAAGTFNHIKNLDLSFNQIPDVGELRYWRNKFPNLEHLILLENPVSALPGTAEKMKQWYPKLKLYNNNPVPEANAPSVLPKTATAALELLPNDMHPEIPSGSDYGQPRDGKPGDQVMKEQMALRFSYETRLNIQLSEQCLQANQFDYGKALADLQNLFNNGQIQDNLLWSQ